MKLRHLMFVLLLVAFAASGCIFSPDDNPDDGGTEPPPSCDTAATADEALVVFRDVYTSRELDCYRKLLSEDYLFVKKDGTVDNFDTEMIIADRMFNGIAGQNNYIIADITIDILDPRDVWLPTPENDPDFGGFPGSQFRTYDVFMQFVISGEDLTLVVQGVVIFYVMDEGTDGNPDFKILGQRDLTNGGDDG